MGLNTTRAPPRHIGGGAAAARRRDIDELRLVGAIPSGIDSGYGGTQRIIDQNRSAGSLYADGVKVQRFDIRRAARRDQQLVGLDAPRVRREHELIIGMHHLADLDAS